MCQWLFWKFYVEKYTLDPTLSYSFLSQSKSANCCCNRLPKYFFFVTSAAFRQFLQVANNHFINLVHFFLPLWSWHSLWIMAVCFTLRCLRIITQTTTERISNIQVWNFNYTDLSLLCSISWSLGGKSLFCSEVVLLVWLSDNNGETGEAGTYEDDDGMLLGLGRSCSSGISPFSVNCNTGRFVSVLIKRHTNAIDMIL